MGFEIVDFHMHPFISEADNLCMHKDVMRMDADTTYTEMKNAGILKFCGSVIKRDASSFEPFKQSNREALLLREKYNGDYVPGFHVSPLFIEESIAEIDFAHENGIKLIGELVPYMHGWEDYSCSEFSVLLDHIEKYGMLVNIHTMDHEKMRIMAKNHPGTNFVFAHPGEKVSVIKHIEIMKECDNVYLDMSGTGIIRYGVLKRVAEEVGAERLLFGTDYPIGNLYVYINGVLGERLTDREKELIFSKNAKRLLNIK